jgi:hypothetical protein
MLELPSDDWVRVHLLAWHLFGAGDIQATREFLEKSATDTELAGAFTAMRELLMLRSDTAPFAALWLQRLVSDGIDTPDFDLDSRAVLGRHLLYEVERPLARSGRAEFRGALLFEILRVFERYIEAKHWSVELGVLNDYVVCGLALAVAYEELGQLVESDMVSARIVKRLRSATPVSEAVAELLVGTLQVRATHALARGDFALAQSVATEALTALRSLSAERQRDRENERQARSLEVLLGDIALAQPNPDGDASLAHYEAARAISESWYDSDRTSEEALRALHQIYGRIGTLVGKDPSRQEEARTYHLQVRRIANNYRQRWPRSLGGLRMAIDAEHLAANVLDGAEAIDALQRAAGLGRELFQLSPSDLDLSAKAGLAHSRLGKRRELPEAERERELESARHFLARIAAVPPTSVTLFCARAWMEWMQTREQLYVETQREKEAREVRREQLAFLRRLENSRGPLERDLAAAKRSLEGDGG